MRRAWPDPVALAAFVVTAGSAAIRATLAFTRGFDPDEFEHLHGGWCLAHGLWPYRDYFEHHTPWLPLALAPWLGLAGVDRDPDAAVRFVLLARAVMWLTATVAVVLTFRLARLWAGTRAAWLAAALLGVVVMFVDKTGEVRPDGPAVACLLGSWGTLLAFLRAEPGTAAARRRLFAAGLLLGAAVMFTQKALFAAPATAAVLGWWVLDGRQAGSRSRRGTGALLFGAALLLPIAATLALFAPHTGVRAFVESNLVLNAAWPVRFSPVPLLRRIADANAIVVALGAAGLARAAWRLRRADALRSGDALLVLQALGLIVGAFVIPTPQPQYFAMLLPLVAILAAAAIVGGSEAAARLRRSPVAGTIAAVLGLAAAAARPLAILTREMRPARAKVEDQLGRLRFVLATTSPADTVMDGFTGAGVFRPHAYYYFFLHEEIRALLGAPEIARLRGELRDGEIAPALVLYDDDLRALPAEITSFIEENYAPTQDPVVWRRKDFDLDGRATGGILEIGHGPTTVLVGRGWSEPTQADRRWVRTLQGQRSTVRVPLQQPADLVLHVQARVGDGASGGHLGLAVNDTPAGEETLRAGWNDYAFPVPTTAWRAGVNRVRLTVDPAKTDPAEVAVERLEVRPPGPM